MLLRRARDGARPVADVITASLDIPTIGIGAGPRCSGQVQVFHDLLGLYDKMQPRFSKRYAELAARVRAAVAAYCDEVRGGHFPTTELHSFPIKDGQYAAFRDGIARADPDLADRVEDAVRATDARDRRRREAALAEERRVAAAVAEQWCKMAIKTTTRWPRGAGSAPAAVPPSVFDPRDGGRRRRRRVRVVPRRRRPRRRGAVPLLLLLLLLLFLLVDRRRLGRVAPGGARGARCAPVDHGGVCAHHGVSPRGTPRAGAPGPPGCDVVVVSIYVNPTQFAAGEDLDTYPHDLAGDLASWAEGVDCVFAPPATDGGLYEAGHRTGRARVGRRARRGRLPPGFSRAWPRS